VWSQNNGFAGVHRFDLATGKGETWSPFKDSKEPHNIYDCHLGFAQQRVLHRFPPASHRRIDAKTGQVTLYETPTKGSSPRPARWIRRIVSGSANIGATTSACSTTATGVIKEWKVPTPYSAP